MKILSNKKYRELVALTKIGVPTHFIDTYIEECLILLESTEKNLNKKWSNNFTNFLLEYKETLLAQIKALENMKEDSKK